MNYFFTKKIDGNFDETTQKITEKLKEKGFGVLTEIDIQATLKKKIDVDFYKYKILGACNPHLAYKALQAEDKVGIMLPCNVIVQQKKEAGPVEVSAVDPAASMMAIKNDDLEAIAGKVRELLESAIAEM